MRLDRLIRIAQDNATKQDVRYRHTSVLVYKNRIVSIGVNSYKKTHPIAWQRGRNSWCFVHSEVASLAAYRGLVSDLRHCTMYNVRVGVRGDIQLSKPCQNCTKVMIAFGLRRVAYTNDEGGWSWMYLSMQNS
jgi:deoxycytidylate deaminase